MATEVKNLSEVLNFIQTNPQDAQARAQRWQSFIKTHPVASSHQKIDDFLNWGEKERIDHQTLQALWLGKEIGEAYALVKPRTQTQNPTETHGVNWPGGSLASLAMAPLALLGLRDKTKLMEEDKDYKKIEESKTKLWQEKNPDDDFTSKKWLDYQYGSLEDKTGPALEEKKLPPTLREEAEQELRSNKKYAGKVKKYDKEKSRVYGKIEKDESVSKTSINIENEARARFNALKNTENASPYERVLKKVKQKRWEEFAEKHPEKTNAYKNVRPEIAEASNRVEIKKELLRYKETTGKAVKPVEKIHREPSPAIPSANQEEIVKKLEQAFKPAPSLSGLVLPVDWSEPKPKPKIMESGKLQQVAKPAPSNPQIQPAPAGFRQALKNLQTFRAPQGFTNPKTFLPRTRTSPGLTGFINRGLGGGINKINGLAAVGTNPDKILSSLTNQVGGIASSLLKRVAMANPAAAVIVAIIIVLFFTIINVVGFGGSSTGGNGTSTTPTPTTTPSSGRGPSLDYSIPFRDTSVVPNDIKNIILARWPNAELQNWDNIVNQSIANGWNPAFVLALWIEESGAQGTPNYTDPLGCDPSHPTTDINISLVCLFNFGNKYGFSANGQFADFMCMYSESKLSPCTFSTNPNFPGNIEYWYSQLVPSGNGSLVVIPPPPGMDMWAGTPVFYCQGDPQWGDNTNSCGIGQNGCGPSSIAIILSSFGDAQTPAQTYPLFLQNGWVSCADGLISPNSASWLGWIESQGFVFQPIPSSRIKEYIDNGYLILGSSDNYPIANRKPGSPPTGGHIFVVDGIDSTNNIHVQDPNDCDYTTGQQGGEPGGPKDVVSLNSFNWLWGYAIKKK